MSLKILPPKELKAKAAAKVRAFQLAEKRKAMEAKGKPPVEKPAEKVVGVVEKLSPEEKKELNKLFLFNVRKGNKNKVERLLKAGADVNAKDGSGVTALMWIAYNGYDEITRLLIDTGADVDAKDNDEQTALMYAAGWGHEDVARLLFDAGADVNAKSNAGLTVLDHAIQNNKTKTAEFLKSKGAKLGSELP